MKIRPATAADIPILVELLEELFSHEADIDFDARKSRRGLELMLQSPQNRTVLVGVIEGEIAGMCAGQIVISTAMGAPAMWVEDVILKPQFRGQGLMPQMLAQLEDWAAHRGVARIQLLCDNHNAPAFTFYPKQGFHLTEQSCFYKFPAT